MLSSPAVHLTHEQINHKIVCHPSRKSTLYYSSPLTFSKFPLLKSSSTHCNNDMSRNTTIFIFSLTRFKYYTPPVVFTQTHTHTALHCTRHTDFTASFCPIFGRTAPPVLDVSTYNPVALFFYTLTDTSGTSHNLPFATFSHMSLSH